MPPYRLAGKCVEVNHGGKWVKKGCSSSVEAAKKYLAVLNMREKGIPEKPKGEK